MAWHAKPIGAYARDSTEGIDNCEMIYNQMTAKGWTVNAISAICGNIGYEGGYNPWRYENDIVLTRAECDYASTGYGLPGYTPVSKYIQTANESIPGYAPHCLDVPGLASDGEGQINFLMDNPQYYVYHPAYPLTFDQFKTSTLSAIYLAEVWLMNFEMPTDPSATIDGRKAEASYWYEHFTGTPPTPPIPPKPIRKRKFKWWMYMPMPF